ncbi:CAP10 domain-containing protein [Mycena venus]|uniref:CAP10 domain-containing protein n=1 Tax=Mycena venus TaxID=2733690 RepID=A0A8H7CCY6_9AGAR|nr:CAP10 domain-containing protein [Mycena venus]
MNLLTSLISHLGSPAYSRVSSHPNGRFRQRKFARRWMISPLTIVIVLGGIVSIFAVIFFRRGKEEAPPPSSPLPRPTYVSTGLRTPLEQLFDRQSTTLDQAVARYVLRNDRQPPKNYDKWYKFAKSRECLIDDYDQIQRDFEPFYQLAQKDRTFFKKMVDQGTKIAIRDDMGMKTFEVKRGLVSSKDNRTSNYDGGWTFLLRNISASLPDVNLVFNHRDEPRVAFDARIPNTQDGALTVDDTTPLLQRASPDIQVLHGRKALPRPERSQGIHHIRQRRQFFASADFATDLYPVLSQTKIYPCFADILFPSEFHYTRAPNSPKYAYPNNITWDDKRPTLYWRGQSTGGWISGTNYHSFPRFKLLDIARDHEDIMDIDGCDPGAIKAEYNITGESAPREDVYKYKYVFDVDGNSFSGRYLGLLKSGSLVFKSTIFAEYFDGWLEPFVHYIPVLPDLSDLVDRIEWARANDAEAQRIQRAGQEFVERIITDAQNDCYFFLVLLEWARLQSGAQ